MQINSKPFIQIDREYIITSAELRKALKLEGQIETIGLHTGRSPNDKENGISAEVDKWYIKTIEVKATADNSSSKKDCLDCKNGSDGVPDCVIDGECPSELQSIIEKFEAKNDNP